jgi:hypothetical protein
MRHDDIDAAAGSFAALRDGRRFDVLVRAERPQT